MRGKVRRLRKRKIKLPFHQNGSIKTRVAAATAAAAVAAAVAVCQREERRTLLFLSGRSCSFSWSGYGSGSGRTFSDLAIRSFGQKGDHASLSFLFFLTPVCHSYDQSSTDAIIVAKALQYPVEEMSQPAHQLSGSVMIYFHS